MKPSVSLLHRASADDQATKKSTEQVWKDVQKKRKAKAQVNLLKPDYTSQEVRGLYEAFKKRAAKQKVGEAQHLIVFSGDLIGEPAEKPWLGAPPANDVLEKSSRLLACLAGMKGKADIVVAFDGESRAQQRQIQDALGADAMECILLLSRSASLRVFWHVEELGPPGLFFA